MTFIHSKSLYTCVYVCVSMCLYLCVCVCICVCVDHYRGHRCPRPSGPTRQRQGERWGGPGVFQMLPPPLIINPNSETVISGPRGGSTDSTSHHSFPAVISIPQPRSGRPVSVLTTVSPGHSLPGAIEVLGCGLIPYCN